MQFRDLVTARAILAPHVADLRATEYADGAWMLAGRLRCAQGTRVWFTLADAKAWRAWMDDLLPYAQGE